MNISQIQLKLDREFMTNAHNGECVYHFILLAKYRSQLEASHLVSIGNNNNVGRLEFNSVLNLIDLEPEFNVGLEIYVLKTLKEYLPHHTKYHILKKVS